MITVGVVVGETSGDMLGEALMVALRQHFPLCRFVGIGGPLMIAQGCESLYDMERLSVMGFVEPLFRLRELWRMRRHLIHYFSTNKPDVFIGIDAPAFNTGLEGALKAAGIRTVHYVSPSVWAWRAKRMVAIKKSVDLMLTLLPFESEIYEKNNVPHCFVGHPLADQIPLVIDVDAARTQLSLSKTSTVIAVLPGSRTMEVTRLAEPFIRACVLLHALYPSTVFVVPMVNERLQTIFQAILAKCAPHLPVQCVLGQSRMVMSAADVVLVTSGTATLEALLVGKPMVVAYKMSRLSYFLAKKLVKIRFFSLPNLLANENVVPELLQDEATPQALCGAMVRYLDHPELMRALQQRFYAMHEMLRQSASEKAAAAIAQLVNSCRQE